MGVYNGATYLAEAMRSILGQTYRDFELLVVDDGSTDDTAAILASCRDPRLRVLRNERNLGLTRSLNIGLRSARGKLIARHDADDVSREDRLEKQVRAFNVAPDLAVVGTAVRVMDHQGRIVAGAPWARCRTALAIRWQLMFESPFAHGTVMYRRDIVADTLGGYDETFRTSQDFELWSRVVPRHPTTNLLERLVDFRVHAASASSRYGLEGVEKVRQLLWRNIEECIGRGEYEEWIDFWVTVNNADTYGRIDGLDSFPASFRRVYDRFMTAWRGAAGNAEIDMHIAASFARVACTLARFNRGAALRAFALSGSEGPQTAARVLPRFAILMILGSRARSARALSRSQTGSHSCL